MPNTCFDKKKLLILLNEIYRRTILSYKRVFDYRYENDANFRKYIESQYKRNGVKGKGKEEWNDNYCKKMSSMIINRILFIKICKDKGVIKENLDIEKWIGFANYGLTENDKNLIIDAFELLERNDFNFKYADGNILGDVYERFMDRKLRKSIGQFYTPQYIIDYILKRTLENADVVKNPFLSVADISCGSGHFLIKAYDILKDKFISNLSKLQKIYDDEIYIIKRKGSEKKVSGRDYWRKENIHYHILTHCIYGADIDSFGVQLTTINLVLKEADNFIDELNIIQCDSLVNHEEGSNYIAKFWNKKFDYIVGNPPYIGHKQLSMEYKSWLLKNYGEVFKDKSDISFCFFKRMLDLLKDNGMCGIITSRYFMESPTGRELRKYLRTNSDFKEIIDFYGIDIFRGVGVATAIYIFSKGEVKNSKVLVYKISDDNFSFRDDMNLSTLLDTRLFNRFYISKELLGDERWILIPSEHLNIYRKIINNANVKLGDLADSFQGIITGCDKAFVMTEKEAERFGIEKELLRKWIKNSNIKRYEIIDSEYVLIYSDLIDDELKYTNSIDYIYKYKDRLENRRECRKGIRKWYQLQWGRDKKLFEQPKIIFPYKSTINRFAIDYSGYYCSADVYSIILKDEFKEHISLKYLLGILNSSIYEFYFKLFAKKMGKGVYDYYPNSVMDLKIVTVDIVKQIEEKVNNILSNINKIKKFRNSDDTRYLETKEKILQLEKEIDFIIADKIGLNENDINIIYNFLNR